jgi:hypothetical protein
MKKASPKQVTDMRPEYDFAKMQGGIRGKYVKRYQAGTNLVLLDPEVAKAFPTDAAANEALRAVISLTKVVSRPSRTPSRKPASSR